MDKHIIGENAGRVWRLLSSDEQRRWEYSEIKDILGLNDAELGSAIGWLAREDKIQFELEHHNSKDEKAYAECIFLIVWYGRDLPLFRRGALSILVGK